MADVQSILKSIAPTLATALAGPLAGVAARFVTDKTQGRDGAADNGLSGGIESILKDLTSSSAKLNQLKQIESEFKLEMQKLDVDVFKLEVQDRGSARELAKVNMWPQIGISVLFLTVYFALLFYMFTVEISDTANMKKGDNSLLGELQILIGVLTAGIPQILGFWFGGLFQGKQDAPGASRSNPADAP